MIEIIILNHLELKLKTIVVLEMPEYTPDNFVLFEKTGSNKTNHLYSSTFAFQSYSDSLYEAASLNERVKEAVESLMELNEIAGISLNSDYNFTDTSIKKYRYQAVFDIRHY